ncbi:LANO_0A02806g1_1 [Lachancea nothofagi CBS 11611]|uniref:LANO_0A02806g1_1 n=1 Tax=Lachancea nothofagi CBS 11611 TaxID=1266666 RepID=A0A1G4INW3_9SACH|nr:LANO_0A02806g1_1 [Lachancea nothofagi CBS 11611]
MEQHDASILSYKRLSASHLSSNNQPSKSASNKISNMTSNMTSSIAMETIGSTSEKLPEKRNDGKSLTDVISLGELEENTLHYRGDVDLGMKVANESLGLEVDEATNKKLLRKADMFICTMMSVVYAVQYMDKQTNSYASIMGLREDLNMVGNQYSWVGTSFYLGYMIFEIPSSLALQRFPIAKTSGIFILLWGFVLCMTCLPKTYAGFIVTRTILGILESAVTPAFMLLTSQWYKREEQLLRTSIWSASAGLGAILGALIAYGLTIRNAETLPMVSWRLLYVVLGVITIALGLVFLVHVPDTPATAWFLTKQERLLTVERIRTNKQGFGNRHFKMDQLKEVFMDIRTYLYFCLMVAAEIPNGGIGSFGSIMLKDMGFSTTKALLMGMPFGAVEFGGIVLVGYIAQRYQRRMYAAMFSYCLNIFSGCLLAFPASTHAQLAGYYLQGMAVIGWICFISCVSSNTAGHTKKVVTSAICMIGYCVGNLIGPQTFIATEAPHYRSAKIAIVVCFVICLALTIALYYVNVRANKLRDAKNEKLDPSFINSEFADLTDFQNPEFRYSL